LRKIFVLCYDYLTIGVGLSPDFAVIGVAQTCVTYRLCFITCFAQPLRERRRQLGIDQKSH
jgi:hypothetical protein